MKYEDVKKLSGYNDFKGFETDLYMPNEIFDDLKKIQFKSTSHLAFSYSYIYLITWFYRYAKYGQIYVNVKMIKEILGYKPNYEKIDYIIKKDGILDQINYTLTTKDYPLTWEFKEGINLDIEFCLLSDLDEIVRLDEVKRRGRNTKIKYPVKHFHRDKESFECGDLDGIFYDISNTHMIDFQVFLFCMSNKELGCTGFYLYCYLKKMNDKYGEGYDVPLPNLAYETGIKPRTLDKYIDVLKKFRMINCIYNQEYYVAGLSKEERKANTYITNEYVAFSDEVVPIMKMRSMTLEDYEKKKLESVVIEENVNDNLPLNF
ncbi:hypothetical protein [Bacillus weihaiensis]|uniref:Uncharacterized protein n=1 Tax=Bacillus weihaiensis TaxID=1547283 RepID=A0A1L3MU46_9BACI|nr:hypothetical protein [Bacillus weihaiensis]APH05853.1 hypothetical protein A9C19_14535 [Bacillus weihaiensis]